MKKWKLIVITAILCMTVGMQALASEVTEPTQPVENESAEATDQGETPADNEETEIVTNLPMYVNDGSYCWIIFGSINDKGATAVCENGERIDLSPDHIICSYTLAQSSISLEEAQKILGTRKVNEVTAIDFKPAYKGGADNPLNGKTVKEILINSYVHLELGNSVVPNYILRYNHGTTMEEAAKRANGEAKILYFPPGETSYKECQFTRVDSDGTVCFTGLEGTVLPLEGARFVFIWGDPNGATVESENTPSEPENTSNASSSSGEPEVYSHGATVGEIGVKKSGAGVQAQVRKANGEETEVIVHPYLNPGTKTLTQAQARQMLGTSFACSIYSFDLSIVNAQEDYGPVTLIDGTVPVTFFVPGVTPESKVALRHWINGSSTYEDLPVEVGNGTVKAEFTSFSPVVIVVEQPGVAAMVENGPVSPKTGESSVIYVMEAVALLSLLGLFTCRRKRQA